MASVNCWFKKTRDAAAVIRARQVGTQLDGFAEVLQRVVVVAQPRAGDGAVGVGLRVDRIHADRGREIGFGAQQVVEVVFGDAAQEIAFEGVFVETQQGVERADGLLVIVVHHARTSDPEKNIPGCIVHTISSRTSARRQGRFPRYIYAFSDSLVPLTFFFGLFIIPVYSNSYPKRRSWRSLLRQSSLTLTKSCRKTFLPRNSSMSSRAVCPTRLSFSPLWPIRMPFCESRAT